MFLFYYLQQRWLTPVFTTLMIFARWCELGYYAYFTIIMLYDISISLTHFIQMAFFYTPWKYQQTLVFWCFQSV